LERAKKLLAKGEDPQAVLDALAQGLTNKFLHGSLHALQHAQGEEREALMKILPGLFRAHHSDK
jgi:glutamyl-tRNA reductase